MKLHPASQPRGIALIVALIAVAFLSSMAIMFALYMKTETHLAIKADDDQQMVWLGRAGVETAKWVLSEEMKIGNRPCDCLNQIWAGGPGGIGETNSDLAGFSLTDIPVGNGRISIKMEDEERKMNINTAPPIVLQQALTVMGVDAQSISVVSDSILDWVQQGNEPRPAGAKSDYYQGLIPPYYAKEAPMDDISELRLVKGVTPELYRGGSPVTDGNYSGPVFQHKLGFGSAPGQPPDYPFGLRDVFTALSGGRINVNTANANVLQLIPGVDANVAADIIKFRSGPDGVDGTEDDTPFLNPGQLQAVGVPPQALAQINQLCDVRSRVFRVTITACIGSDQRTYIALLFRNSPLDIQTVGFWWDNGTGNEN